MYVCVYINICIHSCMIRTSIYRSWSSAANHQGHHTTFIASNFLALETQSPPKKLPP